MLKRQRNNSKIAYEQIHRWWCCRSISQWKNSWRWLGKPHWPCRKAEVHGTKCWTAAWKTSNQRLTRTAELWRRFAAACGRYWLRLDFPTGADRIYFSASLRCPAWRSTIWVTSSRTRRKNETVRNCFSIAKLEEILSDEWNYTWPYLTVASYSSSTVASSLTARHCSWLNSPRDSCMMQSRFSGESSTYRPNFSLRLMPT